jgi:multidrug resistance efflux pump
VNQVVRLPNRARRYSFSALLLVVLLGGCQHEERRTFEGLAQGDYVRLALPAAGSLSNLEVKPGTVVSAGAPVFSLVEADELAGYRDASRHLAQMQRAGKNGGRADSMALDSLKAEVAQAEWLVSSKSASAPVGGVVTETHYSKGDWVPAGAPVVAILPANAITVRFSVPMDVANQLQQGRDVTITCARCKQPVKATVTYISPFAQPGTEAGGLDALRYMVEARPRSGQAQWLRPGEALSINL